MTAPVQVLIFWTENGVTGLTGGGPQPAGWEWPAGTPLPEVGDKLRAPEGASPLGRGTVRVLERTWEFGTSMYGLRRQVTVLRLDCEWT